jgi:CubicO group peptidase (beta-lactamase class C family)
MTIKTLAAAMLAVTLTAAAPPRPSAPAAARVPAPPATVRPAPILAETKVPSVAIARIENGRITWAGAWGEQSPGVPATTSTLYNVASLSKPISAETVLRAASAGRLGIDEPMHGWWVDPDLAADPRHRLLTPRISLTHRTGFANWRRMTEGKLRFDHEPGTRVGYSGEGFEYMARYAERRTGTPFERLAEELVFRPAGMVDTAYTHRPWFDARLARPTDKDGRWIEVQRRTAWTASDEVHTTVLDYAGFLISVAARQNLSPAVAADRERLQVSIRERQCPPEREAVCPSEVGWGLGWDLAVFGEDRILWHTGADRGEWTFAYVVPRTGEGLVILTNNQEGYRAVIPLLQQVGTHPRFLAYLNALAAAG